MNSLANYSVRAAYCHHRASDDEIYDTICRIVEPLKRPLEKIDKARKIVIKTNMAWLGDIQYFEGRRRELVDDAVMRAVLKFLRERTSAQIIATDVDSQDPSGMSGINYMPLLKEFGAEFINSDEPPFKIYDLPGGGLMFSRYMLSACFADAVISVAKIKTHAFMGITLYLKNLFGLTPMMPHYRPRSYFHHIIRLPYVLPRSGLDHAAMPEYN